MLDILNTFRIKANNSFLIGIQDRHAEGVEGFFSSASTLLCSFVIMVLR